MVKPRLDPRGRGCGTVDSGSGTPSRAGRRPIAVDLFAGAGGLSLGFEQAGFDIAAAVEFDPIHAATHELNFPYSTTICGNVAQLSGREIREKASLGNRVVDVVIGGPPCQGFSLMGHRVLTDPRNTLVFHFLRIVKELKPRTFVMENVPGLATGNHTQLLDELIVGFNEAGYSLNRPVRILNAVNFGVPQDRRRLFILGARRGTGVPEYPEPMSFPPSELALGDDLTICPTVRDAIADLPDVERVQSFMDGDAIRVDFEATSRYAKLLRGELPDAADYSHLRLRDNHLLTGCRWAEHTPLSRNRFAKTTPGTTEPVSHFLKLDLGGTCNTLRAGTATDRGAFTAPRPIHPVFPRCITVREAARLHSYPDWFRFHRTIWHGFRQIGNSVPPFLGRAVGAAVLCALKLHPERSEKPVSLGDERLATFTMRDAAAYFSVSSRTIAPRIRQAGQAVR